MIVGKTLVREAKHKSLCSSSGKWIAAGPKMGNTKHNMHSLKSIRETPHIDLQLGYAASLLEYVLKLVEHEYISDQNRKVSLGELVQRRDQFLGLQTLKDVNFAIGIRNQVFHEPDNPQTNRDRERALKYLLEAIDRHIELCPPELHQELRGQPDRKKATEQKSPLVKSASRPKSKPQAVKATATPTSTPPVTTSPKAAAPTTRTAPPVSRPRSNSGGSGWMLLLLFLGTGFFLYRFVGLPQFQPTSGASTTGTSVPSVTVTDVAQLQFDWAKTYSLPERINALSMTEDGMVIAIGDWKNAIYLMNAETGARRSLIGHTSYIRQLALTPDGKTLASCAEDGAKIWDLGADVCCQTFLGDAPDQQVSQIALTPDGTTLVTGAPGRSKSCVLKVWDVTTGQCRREIPAHRRSLVGVSISVDGSVVCSCAEDRTLVIWDAHTGTRRHTVTLTESERPLAVAIDPNGKTVFLSTSHRKSEHEFTRSVRRYDISTGNCTSNNSDNFGGAFLGFACSGRLLFTGPNDGRLSILDLERGLLYTTGWMGGDYQVKGLSMTADARTFVMADSNQSIRIAKSR